MPKKIANDVIITNNHNYEDILNFLNQDNWNYYSYEELMDIVKHKYNHDFNDNCKALVNIANKMGVFKKKAVKFKRIHIESTFRFMSEVEKENKKREHKKKYEQEIQEKLERFRPKEQIE